MLVVTVGLLGGSWAIAFGQVSAKPQIWPGGEVGKKAELGSRFGGIVPHHLDCVCILVGICTWELGLPVFLVAADLLGSTETAVFGQVSARLLI